jgi:CPA2 family monovalent cation:H+ antiporter-2
VLVDAVVLTAIAIGASVGAPSAARWLGEGLALEASVARWLVFVAAALLAAPFLFGLVLNGRRLGLALASAALPQGAAGRPDLAAAPRKALLAIVQLGATLFVLLPVVALTQPFLPGVPGAVLLVAVILVLGVGFWRSAAALQGHVRAGAQVIVEALGKQGAPADRAHSQPGADALATVRSMLPGIGEPTAIRLAEGSPAVGKSLSALAVRGRTGATILVISRPGAPSVIVPTAQEILHAGDVLVLAGTDEAVDSARALLGAEISSRPQLEIVHGPSPRDGAA